MQEACELKDNGNLEFRNCNFQSASDLYSKALLHTDALSDLDGELLQLHTIPEPSNPTEASLNYVPQGPLPSLFSLYT